MSCQISDDEFIDVGDVGELVAHADILPRTMRRVHEPSVQVGQVDVAYKPLQKKKMSKNRPISTKQM